MEDPNNQSYEALEEYAAHCSVGLYEYPEPGVPHYIVQFGGGKYRHPEEFDTLDEAIKVAAAAERHSMVIERKAVWYKDETWKANEDIKKDQAVFEELFPPGEPLTGDTMWRTPEEVEQAKERLRVKQAQSRLVDDPF